MPHDPCIRAGVYPNFDFIAVIKMHFSIPDTQVFNDETGSSYVGYNIFINGAFHCTLRYRQLHSLNKQLQETFGADNVPPFPPKKFLFLSEQQKEERRALLEKYIQSVGQNSKLMSSQLLNTFLLIAQLETAYNKPIEVPLDVFLMNGYKIETLIKTSDNSHRVLEKVCNQINVPNEHIHYFSLFIMKKEEDNSCTIVRQLHNYESPYVSFKKKKGSHKIVLRKSYWDPDYDQELMNDKVTLNLLYTQTVADIEHSWVFCPNEISHELASLQARGAKKQYLKLARTLKYYGFLQFSPCVCDYPRPSTSVIVSAGHRELNLRFKLNNGEILEGSFRVARMKCWRITTHNDKDIEDNEAREPRMELSFEYLMAKGNLKWITIESPQAILMSICLQSIVDELMLRKNGTKVKQPEKSNESDSTYLSYFDRNGHYQSVYVSQSNSSDSVSSSSTVASNKTDSESSSKRFGGITAGKLKSQEIKNVVENEAFDSKKFSSKRFGEKLVGINTGKLKSKEIKNLVENEAFEGIGDDDL